MNYDNFILGKNCIYSSDCKETGLNNNVIVCGGSGSGKTMSVSEPRLLETYNSSLITTVTKRRIVTKYKKMFLERGYEVWDLNFANPRQSDIGYDPLAYVNSYQDIRHLAESIVGDNLKSDRDPYWAEAAETLLSAEIAYTLMAKEDATFEDVLNMHYSLDFAPQCDREITTTYKKIFDALEKKAPTCFAVTCWKSFCKLPGKTAGCVYGMLSTALDRMFNPEVQKIITMKQQIDFSVLASKKTVLFVTTSPVNPALNSLVNLFYGHAFKQLFEFAEKQPDEMLPIPVHVLCDDFATGSKIHDFAEYISIFREKKVSVTLLLQSESQLEGMYGPDQATTIINNCDSYLYMGGMDLATARNVSNRLNLPLDEVLNMPVGQEILFRRGQKPMIAERYDIMENELYRKVTSEYEDMLASEEKLCC